MNIQLSSRYSLDGMNLAKSIMQFPFEYSNLQRCRAYRYAYMFYKTERNMNPETIRTKILSFFEELIRKNPIDMESVQELGDTLHKFCPADGEMLLNRIREIDEEREERERIKKPPKKVINKRLNREVNLPVLKSVYQDSQNVHNTKINDSMCNAIITICELMKPVYSQNLGRCKGEKYNLLMECQGLLTADHPSKREIIEKSINYFYLSVATFSKKEIDLSELFISLYMWIVNNPSRGALELRLIEELESMDGYCNSGHASRLINVIQGFTDDERLIIKIDMKSQCKSVISAFLTKKLQECTDERVLDGIIEMSDAYTEFVKDVIRSESETWLKEYGDEFVSLVPSVLYDYVYIRV
jgi:DNA-directed RNA polymerase subunit M/transcription elongation factor TFIIS